MNLEGSLDAFSLPDIFQLLSFTKKTGALNISRASSRGVVYFNAGTVTGASSDSARLALARRLVGAGLVGEEAFEAALETAATEGGPAIARALRDVGALDEGTLHEHAVEQATDAVFDLLRWTEGTFSFEVETQNPDGLGATLTVEDVIGEARRRLDEWETLTKVVPSPDSVVSVQLTTTVEATLAPEEWSLLALVDGHRSVAELVALTGRGEFAVVKTLAALVERNMIVIRRPSEPDRDSVSALLRRQSELSRLEGRYEPPPAPPAPPAAVPAPPPVREAAEPVAQAPAAAADVFVPEVVPAREEPAPRAPDFPEDVPASVRSRRAAVQATPARGTTGSSGSVIERDPSVNKSLLLRLIAGVRGL